MDGQSEGEFDEGSDEELDGEEFSEDEGSGEEMDVDDDVELSDEGSEQDIDDDNMSDSEPEGKQICETYHKKIR